MRPLKNPNHHSFTTLKFLPIPSIATIRNGPYPIRQRMHLVFLAPNKDRIPAMTADFQRFLLSQDGHHMVTKNGLITADPAGIPDFLG